MSKYRNGYGQTIYNPKAYYRAVREDRYGYNRNNRKWIPRYLFWVYTGEIPW